MRIARLLRLCIPISNGLLICAEAHATTWVAVCDTVWRAVGGECGLPVKRQFKEPGVPVFEQGQGNETVYRW